MLSKLNTFFIATGGQQTYGPGNEVTGHIVLRNAKPELLGKIVIKLWGGVHTVLEDTDGSSSSDVRHGRKLLFLTERPVEEKSTALKGGQECLWPFAVRFPTVLDLPAVTMHPIDESLPPSYEFGDFSTVSRIEYKLTVVIYKHASPDSLYEFEKLIRFVPTMRPEALLPDPYDLSDLRKYVAKSRNLHPIEDEYDSKGSKGAKWSLLHRKDQATAAFNFTLHRLAHAIVGESIQIHINVEHLLTESTTLHAPMVNLESCMIAFKAADRLEAPGLVHETGTHHSSQVWSHVWQDQGAFTENEGWTKTLTTNKIPDTVPPTFSTFNIKRTYSVMICATISVADKKFEYKTSPGKGILRLYPRRAPLQTPSMSGVSDPSASRAYREDMEEDLPCYEEVFGTALT